MMQFPKVEFREKLSAAAKTIRKKEEEIIYKGYRGYASNGSANKVLNKTEDNCKLFFFQAKA